MAQHEDGIARLELLLGRRWTLSILMTMADHTGALRYSELARAIPGLSKRLLTERLTELETAGLVERHVSTTRPVAVSYTLTRNGAALRSTFRELRTWLAQQPA